MKYHVTLRGHTYVIEVSGGAVTVDGERLEAHWAAIPGTPLIHLLLGKHSWTVACQRLDNAGRRWAMGAAGERLEVDVQDDRSKQVEELTGQGRKVAAGGLVRAPMPGLVVRVEVTVGADPRRSGATRRKGRPARHTRTGESRGTFELTERYAPVKVSGLPKTRCPMPGLRCRTPETRHLDENSKS